MKITRISRCPGSICSRGGDDVVEIKSSFDRRGGQGRRGWSRRAKCSRRGRKRDIAARESALKKLFPPRRDACVHYRSEFIRTTAILRYRGYDNAFSVRAADVRRRYVGSLSSSHSGSPVYGVTSILHYGIFHGQRIVSVKSIPLSL